MYNNLEINNKVRALKILFTVFIILGHSLLFAEFVATKHTLEAGSSVEFYPKQGESLSIAKDLNHLIRSANYDIVMKNGKRIYFRNKNQEDDMYIVFNEATEPGDVVIVKVNRGYFTYTTQALHSLPKTVQKVLKASAKSRRAKKRAKQTKNVIVETEEFCFDNTGEICDCSSPKALINQKNTFLPTTEQDMPSSETEKVSVPQKEKSEPNIFKTFAQKLQEAFAKIKSDLTPDTQKEIPPQKIKGPELLHSSEKTADRNSENPTPLYIKQESRKETSAEDSDKLNRYNMLSDHEVTAAKQIARPHFTALPPSGKEEFLRTPLPSEGRVTTPLLQKPQQPEQMKKDIMFSSAEKPKTLYQPETPKALERLSAYDDLNSAYKEPAYTSTGPSFHKPKERDIAASTISLPHVAAPDVVKEQQIRKIESYSGPEQKNLRLPQSDVVSAVETSKPQLPQISKRESQKGLPVIDNSVQSIAQGPVAQPVFTNEMKPEIKEEIPVQEPADMQENEEKDKIIITKILDKKKPAPAPENLERMSDRMLGGGYSDRQNLGKLSVRAYSNKKPVSAWVEVYKGKHRVKSFYTGNKKELKLPVGTYILKATYRTGTAKQKKNLGKVKLKEGESVRKKVYFNVGKLRILATRKGKPVYVKVEIYKKGSKRRYAYTFSSHSTGEANMQLSEGKYKIVVVEHGTKKVFDNVYVKGNSSKTLRVEF